MNYSTIILFMASKILVASVMVGAEIVAVQLIISFIFLAWLANDFI